MADGTEIRAQVAADNLLQDEINRGLEILSAPLPAEADLRMIRVLARILESSWIEHIGFQHCVVYPIVAAECSGVLGIQLELDRLREEHKALAELQAALSRQFARLLRGNSLNTDNLQALVGRIFHQRSRHFDAEECIADRLPPSFEASDIARYREWLGNRLAPRFPVGLLARRQLPRRKRGPMR
jgi:hypothetical protein